MDNRDGGWLKADQLEIRIDDSPITSPIKPEATTQKLKLYNVATLPQKIQLWIIVLLSLLSLISNFVSIASTVGILPNRTCGVDPVRINNAGGT